MFMHFLMPTCADISINKIKNKNRIVSSHDRAREPFTSIVNLFWLEVKLRKRWITICSKPSFEWSISH
jgi:hypothetical protein